jgi:hypothetical protein
MYGIKLQPLDMSAQNRYIRWNTLSTFRTSACMLLVLLISSACAASYAASSSTTNLRRSLQQEDISFDPTADNGDSSSISTRIIIEPFQLQLSNVTSIFTESDLFTLRDTMEWVALADIKVNTVNSSFSNGVAMGEIELLRFGGAKQLYNDDFQVVMVKFDFGVAQYSSLPTPNASTINEWLQAAFTTKLLPALQQTSSSSFQTIENISYGLQSSEEPPLIGRNTTNNDGTGVKDDNSDGSGNGTDNETGGTTRKSSNRSNVPLIAGTTAGVAACIVVLILGFTARQRRQDKNNNKAREITDTLDSLSPPDVDQSSPSKKTNKKRKQRNGSDSNETSPSSSKGGDKEVSKQQSKGISDDGRSLADSESEWTVGTEAGDTMALKNILPNPMMLNKSNPNVVSKKNDHHINLVLSESFERDRKVAITKDMLTGQWSGRVSNCRNGNTGAQQQQSESVLQPSHFSASQERRMRKAAQKRAAVNDNNNNNVGSSTCPDRETSSISSKGDESSIDDSLIFEQAHEDVWTKKGQVSPSRTSKRRSRDISPPPPMTGAIREIA